MRLSGETTFSKRLTSVAVAVLGLFLGACGDFDPGTVDSTDAGVDVLFDASTPDTALPETSAPDTAAPETLIPDTTPGETTEPVDTDTPQDTSELVDTDVPMDTDIPPDTNEPIDTDEPLDTTPNDTNDAGDTDEPLDTTPSDTADTSEPTLGNTCAAPLTLTLAGDALVGSGDLLGDGVRDEISNEGCTVLGDSFDSDGTTTPDQAWSFTLTAAGNYTVEVTSGDQNDMYFSLFSGLGCETNACLGMVDNAEDAGTDSYTFALAAGSYTLVVDTFATFAAGSYEIRVAPACEAACTPGMCGGADGCGGTCGCAAGESCDAGICVASSASGNTCEAPFEPLADSDGAYGEYGDLSEEGVSDAISLADCTVIDGYDSDGVGTPDQAFSFDITEAGIYLIEVLSDTDVDVNFALFVGDSCNSDSCVGMVDNAEDGDIDSYAFDLPAGTYTVAIDTWDTDSAGAYLLFVTPIAQTCAPDLFFSEYIEGSGNDKALEIFNGSGAAIDLSDYEIWRANNGDTVADSGKFPLTATAPLANGDTWVICHGQADAGILAECDQNAGSTLLANFNGDDYIALVKNAPTPQVIDAIGVEGQAPAGGWTVGQLSTVDSVVWRDPYVTQGNPTWTADEWYSLPATTADEALSNSDLGTHFTFWICE